MTQFSIATKEYVDEQTAAIRTGIDENGLSIYYCDATFLLTDDDMSNIDTLGYVKKSYPITTSNIPNQYYNVANIISTGNVGTIKMHVSNIGHIYAMRSFIDESLATHYIAHVAKNGDAMPISMMIDIYCGDETIYINIVKYI